MGLTKVELKGLDDGTDGQIITYDANGNPVAVGPGTDGQVLTSTGAGSPPAFEDAAGGTALTGSTNNTITTVTGANAIQGEANLTFDGTALSIGGATHGSHSTFSDIFLGGAAHLYAETTGGAGNSLSISQNAHVDSDGSWEYIVTDEASNIYQYSGKIGFRTAPSGTAGNDISWTERLTVANTGDVTVGDGNLVIGTSGHGINFDTAGSGSDQLLEDYEEGTFSPIFDSGTGGGSLTASSNYANQTGHYVKVGNMVTLQIDIKCASSGTGSISGELRISNLPFGNGGNAGVAVGFGFSQNLSNTHPNAAYMFGGGGTNLWLQERTPDNGEDPCEANQVTDNTRVVCGVTYRTT